LVKYHVVFYVVGWVSNHVWEQSVEIGHGYHDLKCIRGIEASFVRARIATNVLSHNDRKIKWIIPPDTLTRCLVGDIVDRVYPSVIIRGQGIRIKSPPGYGGSYRGA
jgi:hypothetical protein